MGVARHPNGALYFVRGVWPGEECRLQILEKTHANKKYGFATALEITASSPHRLQPICPHCGFDEGHCSGCPWMFISYEEQLKEKQNKVKFTLEKYRLSKLAANLKPIIPAPKTLGYRNRAQIKTDGQTLGFVSEGTNVMAPIKDCLVLSDKTRLLLKNLREQLPKPEWQPDKDHAWNFIDIDDDMEVVDVVLNRRRAFKQGNSTQNRVMQDWLKKKLKTCPKDVSILELFCGQGNFTEVISQLGFAKILACEVSLQAIQFLMRKKWPNVQPIVADLNTKQGWELVEKNAPDAEILVLDPPREGWPDSKKIKQLKQIKKIFYISCDLDSLARDIKTLVGLGFMETEIQPLDLFPHTPHVEVLAYLNR